MNTQQRSGESRHRQVLIPHPQPPGARHGPGGTGGPGEHRRLQPHPHETTMQLQLRQQGESFNVNAPSVSTV